MLSPLRDPRSGLTDRISSKVIHARRDQQVTRQQFREFLLGHPTALDAPEECGRDEDETDARLGQALVDLPHERLAKDDVLLAEPGRHVLGFEEVVQFSRGLTPVVPGVTEEQVVGLGPTSMKVSRNAARSASASDTPPRYKRPIPSIVDAFEPRIRELWRRSRRCRPRCSTHLAARTAVR